MKKYFLAVMILVLSACTSLQEVSRDSKEYHSKGFVKIRNSKQYVTIGTKDIEKPILLYLHGGPGLAQTPITFPYFKELEKDFIVVFWDQRGAGKSFNGFNPSKYQTVDSFIEDTKEITKYLINKFNKEKIYLIGNSWGSLLGMETIKKYPELYYAYVGTGQMVDVQENLKKSYDLIFNIAIENKDKELEKN